jgi:hypothetical protein
MMYEGRIEGRFGGTTHTLHFEELLRYESPALEATLDPETFKPIDLRATGLQDGTVTLVEAATLYAIARGLASMPQLPVAGQMDDEGRVPEPV